MKVIIVGSGLLGLTTAYYLRRGGAEVCVVDRRPGPGLETSFANGGMLHASQANPWNEPGILGAAIKMLGREGAALLIRAKALPAMLGWGYHFIRESRPHRYVENLSKNARLARYSLNALAEIRNDIEINYDQKTSGTIKMLRTQEGFENALRFCDRFDQLEIPYEICDVAALIKLEPALGPIEHELAGALYFPSDEVGDAYKYCQSLYRWCRDNGVDFNFDRNAREFRQRNGAIEALLCDEDELKADSYVVACGSYSPLLAKSAGVALPIQPVKGYSITVPVGEWQQPPEIAVIDDQMHAAVCPLGDRLRVAGTAEFAGFDCNITPSRIRNLISLLQNVYPQFMPYFNESSLERWTGLRPMTYDGVGIVSGTAIDNLYVNAGHGHLGWTMAPGSGKALGELMLGQRSELAIGDYSVARFA